MIGKKEQLFNKALAIHIITGSILILLLCGMLNIIQYRNLDNQKMRTGMLVSSHISIAGVDPIVQTLAYDRIPRVIDELLGSTPHIKYIAVHDLTGNVVASVGLAGSRGLTIEQLKYYYQEIADKSVHVLKNDTQEILAGLSNKNEIIGIARIGLSNAYIKAQIIRTVLLLSGFGLVLLSFSILIYFVFLNKKLGRPLEVTTALMQEYRERPDADISRKLKEFLMFQPNNEIGLMMQTFEGLITVVEADKKALIEHKEELNEEKEKLRQSEARFRAAFESASDCILIWDKDYNYLYANQAAIDHVGTTHDKVIGKNIRDGLGHIPDFMHLWMSRVDRVFETGKVLRVQDETTMQGQLFFTDSVISPIRNPDGSVSAVCVLYRDITEHRRAEEEIRKLGSAVEQSIDGIAMVDMEARLTYVNKAIADVHGYSPKEMIGMQVQDLHGDEQVYKSAMDQIKTQGFCEGEIGLMRKDGTPFPAYMSVTLLKDNDGNPASIIAVLRDITEQKRIETQLQQAQRMEALGTLGGGVAHDFNNLLMGIQGRTSLMLMDKESSHPDYEHLKGIEDYVKSAADLTKQLLGFARGGKYEVKPTDINELIKKSSKMFARTKKEIKINRKYQKHVWTIEADQGQIDQVFMNLYVNAWQAMPGGGDLYVQTENVTLDEDYVKPFEIEPGKYVKISVTDTGVGMDEATHQRIFDPFFTTKEMDRGTGLGLASAYGIIKNHGGFINVYSEKGEGTTFNIYLPASEKEIIEEKELSKDVLGGSETVLLVDDENMIIEVGEQLLQKLGYKVLIAGNGKEAIDIYEKNKDKIDIIILDMIMPDMSGGDTFDRLKEIKSDVKVLLSSGYSINGQAADILEGGCNGFIQKPFNMKGLSQKLRQILDKE